MYWDVVGGAATCMPNRAARGIKQKIDYISMETDYLDGDMSNIVNILCYILCLGNGKVEYNRIHRTNYKVSFSIFQRMDQHEIHIMCL